MVNILARILDSEQNFNGSADPDPMITADRRFIQVLGPDFGFWLLGSRSRIVDLNVPLEVSCSGEEMEIEMVKHLNWTWSKASLLFFLQDFVLIQTFCT